MLIPCNADNFYNCTCHFAAARPRSHTALVHRDSRPLQLSCHCSLRRRASPILGYWSRGDRLSLAGFVNDDDPASIQRQTPSIRVRLSRSALKAHLLFITDCPESAGRGKLPLGGRRHQGGRASYGQAGTARLVAEYSGPLPTDFSDHIGL